jgi:hypothetical protein
MHDLRDMVESTRMISDTSGFVHSFLCANTLPGIGLQALRKFIAGHLLVYTGVKCMIVLRAAALYQCHF